MFTHEMLLSNGKEWINFNNITQRCSCCTISFLWRSKTGKTSVFVTSQKQVTKEYTWCKSMPSSSAAQLARNVKGTETWKESKERQASSHLASLDAGWVAEASWGPAAFCFLSWWRPHACLLYSNSFVLPILYTFLSVYLCYVLPQTELKLNTNPVFTTNLPSALVPGSFCIKYTCQVYYGN